MTTKKTIAKKETAVPMPSFAKAEGRGSENITSSDLIIPRISIVQALSPERKKTDPAYIEGAEEGMMFNTVTRELYQGAILVIPVYYRLEFLLWKIRKEGGGFRGVYPNRETAYEAARELTETTELQDTAQQFCLVSSDSGETWSEAVLSMAKSNMSVSRQWNSDIRLRCGHDNLDRFVTMYYVQSTEKSNDKGDFYIFSIKFARYLAETEEELYRRAEDIYESIAAGTKDVDRSYDKPEGETDADVGF